MQLFPSSRFVFCITQLAGPLIVFRAAFQLYHSSYFIWVLNTCFDLFPLIAWTYITTAVNFVLGAYQRVSAYVNTLEFLESGICFYKEQIDAYNNSILTLRKVLKMSRVKNKKAIIAMALYKFCWCCHQVNLILVVLLFNTFSEKSSRSIK